MIQINQEKDCELIFFFKTSAYLLLSSPFFPIFNRLQLENYTNQLAKDANKQIKDLNSFLKSSNDVNIYFMKIIEEIFKIYNAKGPIVLIPTKFKTDLFILM
jgi:hypothetical protein